MQGVLLVPLDGMPLAETALPAARQFAHLLSTDVTLLRVVPRESPAEADPGAQAYLDKHAAALRDDGLTVATRVMRGDPGEAIVRDASAEHVVLVVMTTHARVGLRRAILGSVAEYVVAHAPAPILVVRAGVHPQPRLGTILVPIDLSSGAPLTATLDLARAAGAHVVLLTVVRNEDIYVWQWQAERMLDEPQAVVEARRHLEQLATLMRAAGVTAEVRVAIGPTVQSIHEVASVTNADLIVMATHARTGAPRAVLGSVADGVLHAVDRPLLLFRVVPAPNPHVAPIDVYHEFQHDVEAAAVETIVEPLDPVHHGSPAPRWRHLSPVGQ